MAHTDAKFEVDESTAAEFSSANSMLSASMPTLVKGAGYAKPGGNTPLDDDEEIFKRSMRAETALVKAVKQGVNDPQGVMKSWSPEFANNFGAALSANPQTQAMQSLIGQVQDALRTVNKDITLTSPAPTGLVPFDLVAPSRLIYPVYSPFRNKIPRVPGQGTSRRAKVITGIAGSQTGASGGKFVDMSINEFVGGSNLGNWPLQLPASDSSDEVELNVPYRFWGRSENLSWLAQFAGQGFEDISALANLMLLQKFMLNEEAADICASSLALATPGTPTGVAARSAGSSEVGLSGVTTNVYVKVTAATLFGETAASASASTAATNGQVVDLSWGSVQGALFYNIYVSTGTAAGTFYKMGSTGGVNFTLQGALPTSGATAPAVNTTSSSTMQEGIVPTLSGLSTTGGASAIYPTGWQGGYVNQAVGDTLKTSVVNTALAALWDGTGAFRADPAEIVAEGGDVMRLSNDVVSSGANTNYRLFVEQSEVPGVRVGAAVSEFQNPITKSIIKVVVHPWLPQGNALLMSYNLPFSWSNVSNVWEKTLVQDYLSISWPVIDASFRYSMFMYGSLVCQAPQYCGLIGGLQKTDKASGTTGWS